MAQNANPNVPVQATVTPDQDIQIRLLQADAEKTLRCQTGLTIKVKRSSVVQDLITKGLEATANNCGNEYSD